MDMVTTSAPGKVHLIGEHAVVYGEPAIIAAVGMRCFVSAEKSDKVSVVFKQGGYENELPVEEVRGIGNKASDLWEDGNKSGDFSNVFDFCKGNKFCEVSIGTVLNDLGINEGVSINIDQNVPLGSGLGSSAAYSVALIKAISELFGKNLSLEEVNRIAYRLEQFKHGKPSGGDNSTCCFGGLVWFQKGNPNTIKSMKEEIPYKLENFVLAYTKKPEKTTGELVQMVMNLEPEYREPRIKALGRATLEMREALKAKDFGKVKELINLAQEKLAELKVSIPEIDKVCEKVKEIGGAAKGCGALGGGVVLCYHEDKEKLIGTIKSFGIEPWEADLAVEGVRKE